MDALGETLSEIIRVGGPFGAGAVLSAVIYWLSNREASRERRNKWEIDERRERELLKQISVQEDRLAKLHAEKAELTEGNRNLKTEVERIKDQLQALRGDRLL